jgi:hypothetical protein
MYFLLNLGGAAVHRCDDYASYQGTPSGVPHRHVQMTPLGAVVQWQLRLIGALPDLSFRGGTPERRALIRIHHRDAIGRQPTSTK